EGVDDEVGYDNAKHPNHWSYPERVIGFAYTSLRRYDYSDRAWVPTYLTATPHEGSQPGRFTFCTPALNQCDKDKLHRPGDYPEEPPGPCLRDDLKCWWHAPVTWTNCAATCGREVRRYTTVEPRPLVTNIYPAQCGTTGLPAGARIIDDISTSVPLGSEGCPQSWTKGGSFALKFAGIPGPNGTTIHPSKVDFHQIGGGFGGHFWFAHTLTAAGNEALKATGTWTVDPVNAWARVFVHTPDHGAHTRQADYKIFLPGQATTTRHRTIPTRTEANTWVDIGVFDFRGSGKARIELSNITQDGTGVEDVAWDAIAVQPLPAKPKHFVVAMGDSFSAGEGAGDYYRVGDQYGDDPALRNACRRSPKAWSRQLKLAGAPEPLGVLADRRDNRLDYHFVACSGARTHNVMASRNPDGSLAPANRSGRRPGGQFHELSQIDQGFLDENTTLVVLTIGGNDARFSKVGMACATALNCAENGFVMEGDSRPLREEQLDLIRNKVKPDVQRVLADIRRAAPNAWIELAGYPNLFYPGSTWGVTYDWPGGEQLVWGFSEPETAYLNDLSRVMATEVLDTDAGRRFASVDVRGEFGGHELSGPGSTYFHGFVEGDWRVDEDGEPVQPAGMETFHPNPGGNAGYARAAADHLAAFDYRW
ncbi:MAG TPA: SGNH/GDSL hydrolase family protein, partial [Pilimelia sp.]|nr:SGNH/GDSL hydrolase family protein [Pilimelia sp.]